jgi:hypothetical protein
MTDLQKPNQGLIPGPPGTLLVKVPNEFYQQWYALAQKWNMIHKPIHERQEEMYTIIMEWVSNYYPSYGMVAFEDLREDEAIAVSKKAGRTITWGMYILLQIGGSMQPISITDKLLNNETI